MSKFVPNKLVYLYANVNSYSKQFNFKKEYVYRPYLFFLLYILKCRKGTFYRYEQTNVIYGNKFSKTRTINRICCELQFLLLSKYAPFHEKHLLYKLLKHYKLMSAVCMLLIGLSSLEMRAHWLYAAARHSITPTPMTTSPTLNISSDIGSPISDSRVFIRCCIRVTTSLHFRSHASLDV